MPAQWRGAAGNAQQRGAGRDAPLQVLEFGRCEPRDGSSGASRPTDRAAGGAMIGARGRDDDPAAGPVRDRGSGLRPKRDARGSIRARAIASRADGRAPSSPWTLRKIEVPAAFRMVGSDARNGQRRRHEPGSDLGRRWTAAAADASGVPMPAAPARIAMAFEMGPGAMKIGAGCIATLTGRAGVPRPGLPFFGEIGGPGAG